MTITGPLVIGDQRLLGHGTGVATYSRAVITALTDAGAAFSLIDVGREAVSVARPKRWLRAFRLGARRGQFRLNALVVSDVFREAQVYFDIYRRPMPVVCHGASGIVHWTYPVPIQIIGWRNIYTVHDTIPLCKPDLTPISSRRYRRMIDVLLSSDARLMTVSEASRSDIARHFNCSPSLIAQLSEGVDVAHTPVASLPAGLRSRGYLLFCGSIEPRKNIVRLIAAWNDAGRPLPLVIAGPRGWKGERIDIVGQGAIHLDYLPRDTLLTLVRHARALLMPSLAEGFGLPVIEAMALGTPVVTSAVGALAETAGDAAVKVDPEDQLAISEAIRTIAADDALCYRLAEKGFERARDFSMVGFARRLTAFYEEVARGHE